jgi:hypothetical protein
MAAIDGKASRKDRCQQGNQQGCFGCLLEEGSVADRIWAQHIEGGRPEQPAREQVHRRTGEGQPVHSSTPRSNVHSSKVMTFLGLHDGLLGQKDARSIPHRPVAAGRSSWWSSGERPPEGVVHDCDDRRLERRKRHVAARSSSRPKADGWAPGRRGAGGAKTRSISSA